MLNYNFWIPTTPNLFKLNLFEFNLNYGYFTAVDFINPLDLLFIGFQSILFSLNAILILSNFDLLFNLVFKSLLKCDGLTLISSFYMDNLYAITVNFKTMQFLNVWFYYDSVTPLYLNAPEYIIILGDFFSIQSLYGGQYSMKLVYEILPMSTHYIFFEFFNYLIWLLLLLFFFLIFLHAFRLVSFSDGLNSLFTKLYFFFWSFSSEQRLNFSFIFTWFTFFFFIWVPILMTYDDQNTEFVELMHFFIVVVFFSLITLLLIKYSIHYFSFLENSISEGYSVNFLLKQFVRDVANSFALFLRFFLLIFRLNIYDGLDDFLDSYYIFFIDFDEENYYDESFFIPDNFLFLVDNHEDLSIKSTVEYSIWFDFYSKYFVVITKFLYFWIFILEEIFRVTLALYISYLIIFEIHSVNTSYNEDLFIRGMLK